MQAGWYSNASIRVLLAGVLLGTVWLAPFRLSPPVRGLSYRHTSSPYFLSELLHPSPYSGRRVPESGILPHDGFLLRER